MDTLVRHRKMLFNPRYGTVGLLAMPYFFLFEFLGPVDRATGLRRLAARPLARYLNVEFAVAFFLAAVGLGTAALGGRRLLARAAPEPLPALADVLKLTLLRYPGELRLPAAKYRLAGLADRPSCATTSTGARWSARVSARRRRRRSHRDEDLNGGDGRHSRPSGRGAPVSRTPSASSGAEWLRWSLVLSRCRLLLVAASFLRYDTAPSPKRRRQAGLHRG